MTVAKNCLTILGILQLITIGFKIYIVRDGPLDIWGGGGGWAKTKKKFAHRKNPEKKYRAQQTYWKKKSSKARGDFKNCNAIILKH